MTGRYALTIPAAAVREHFGYSDTPDFPARDPILPGEPIALVTAEPFTGAAERRFLLARWGLLPSFVREAPPLIVNARAENIMDKPSFAPAFRRRRCLVPASAFYVATRGRWLRVAAADGGPLALAGLHEPYMHPNGSEMDTACLVTICANATLAALNERMPVIVPRADFSAWLDHEGTSLAEALALLRPASETLLRVEADTNR